MMNKCSRIYLNFQFKTFLLSFLSFFWGKTTNQKFKKKFLNKIKKKIGKENILLTSQGRVAAYNIFKFLVDKGKKEFLISPFTLTEVINSIKYAKGIVTFVEIDLNTGLPLMDDLKKKISNNTSSIILTQLYSSEKDIADFKKNIPNEIYLIEDNAINFGAKNNNNKFYGTLFDFGFFSFNYMKVLPCFHGGLIYAKKKNHFLSIKKQLKKRNFAYPKIKALKLILFCLSINLFFNRFIFSFFTYFIFSFLKINKIKFCQKYIYPSKFSKFDKKIPDHYFYDYCENFSIAALINFKNFDKLIKEKQKKKLLYEKYLNKNLILKKYKNINNNVYNEYPIILKKNPTYLMCDKIFENGYDLRRFWYPNNVSFSKKYKNLKFKNCNFLQDYILCLPTNKFFNENDIKYISNFINSLEKLY